MKHLFSQEKFFKFIEEQKNSFMVILIVHKQADPDAIGAALGITEILYQINPNLNVYLLKTEISKLTWKIINNYQLKIPMIDFTDIKENSLLIYIDKNCDDPIPLPNCTCAVYDHHVSSQECICDFKFISSEYTSTSEIVASTALKYNFNLSNPVASFLIAGMIYDSKRFMMADYQLFKCVFQLLEKYNINYYEILELVSGETSFSEKIACLKAGQRMKLLRINDFLVVVSYVSSFEASAARKILSMGADIVAVISNRKECTRISLRSTPFFYSSTNISLGKDIISELINKFGGTGGGHNNAAGYNSSKNIPIEEVKAFFLSTIQALVNRRAQNNA